ncbi:prephenate dehydratase [Corynebacterium pelargi]|uniref:Prephenate dehydratase n=1 Tax=Corynebacterium pelargi TaxID=1471400 RepID=A0A410W699_9CORY|nr:prephenate dehydratase [Corynebacterium pelargi]QAU51470.1 Prephenate dehydratase [Corynebacterium pelargi]GGG79410.1 prephenate dehydratase [Corynebacterium pelargi]
MRIAFLGPRGTFTEAALHEFQRRGVIDANAEAVAAANPREAVHWVREQQVDLACVAIENSVDGPVTPTFDALAEADGVQIYAEVDLAIEFALMSKGIGLEQAKKISTHPVAYQQIRQYLDAHAPGIEFVAASSNAAAARAVAEGEVDLAAAPAHAAQVYGLSVVADQVADVPDARTRFVLVGRRGKPAAATGSDRSSVMFTLHNKPGALVSALGEFAMRGVDLTRIESRPTRRGLGTYRFHVDILGHINDQPVSEALRALYLASETLTFLGSWPAASIEAIPQLYSPSALQASRDWLDAMKEGK